MATKTGNKTLIFKTFTSIAGAYHVVLGVSALILPANIMVKVVEVFMGFPLILDEQMLLVAKFTGAYLLVFGIMLLILAYDPIKYKLLILPALLLFGVRILNKLFLSDSISALYNPPLSRSIFALSSLAAFFFVIWLASPRSK